MVTCSAISGISIASCTVSGSIITITTSAEIPKGTTAKVWIGNFTTPTVPSATSFTVTTKDANGTSFAID